MLEQNHATKAHAERVLSVLDSVKSFFQDRVAFRIFRGSSNSTRAAAQQQVVDISAINHLISIDETRKTAVVEPGIAMDQLVKQLLGHNLMPAVVPEFPGITAGGAFAGTAAESSCFRYGYFDKTVNRVEMVLGNGDVVFASPSENADLFFGSAGALGTLGITTQLEIRLVDNDQFVEVTYVPVTSHREALQHFERIGQEVDFVDGIVFSSRHGVVVEGRLTGKQDSRAPVVSFTRAKDPWFFTHVYKIRCEAPSRDYKCLTCH
jgi:delta24-sterol reductase